MPNRIIREGFLDAEALTQAGELAEVLFTRLILVADDFGRFDGRLTVICRRCWPNGGPSEESVRERLKALTVHGLIVMYEVDGKPYLFVPNFKQRTRSVKSKYPQPPVESLLITDAQQPNAPKSPIEENPSINNELSHDGQMPANGQANDLHPRTYFAFRSSNSYSNGAQGNSTSTPKASAHSTAKAKAAIAESLKAKETAVPPPAEIIALLARRKLQDATPQAPETDGLDEDPIPF